ncbi:hypothetical protein KBY96_12190 [Cyanobium sp. ATX 6A2]|nr:hypothetical protein [Cyanobium sp. ATX 6A2]
MAEFQLAMDILRTREDFQVQHLWGFLPQELLEEIRRISRSLSHEEIELHEAASFGRWVLHDHPRLTEVQTGLTSFVSELAGEPLEPSYNFLSLYSRLGRCPIHMDAPQAKYTLDVCIQQSQPWDIHLSQIVPWPEAGIEGGSWDDTIRNDPELSFKSYALKPGDAILFSGSSQWHYRDPIPSPARDEFCDLLFFHYIPLGTGKLVNPAQWPEIFCLPELAELPEIRRHSCQAITRWQ